MPKNVQMPDGRVVEFPDSMSDDQISAAAQKLSAPQSGHSVSAEPAFFSKAGLKKFAYETADRLTNTLPTIGGVGGGIIGAGGGTLLEPGGGSALGAIGGAGIGGMGGEAARQLVRGAIFPKERPQTTAQAADPISSQGIQQAAAEATGQGISRFGTKLAPKVIEASIAPGKRVLKALPEDAAPIGETILNETKGYKPKGIVKELDTKIGDARQAKVAALRNARDQGMKLPIAAPQDMAKLEVEKAQSKNTADYIRGAAKLRDQLHYQLGQDGRPLMSEVAAGSRAESTPIALPDNVDPSRFDDLRQGVDQTIQSFDPSVQGALDPIRKQIRGTMSRSLHDAIPATAPLDQRMTNMIPAREAAWNTSFNPTIERQLIDKLQRPTGALVGGIAGAEEGRRKGGLPGAIIGGTAGLIGGNLVASPAGLTMLGRGLHKFSGPVGTIFRVGVPAIASQVGNKKREDDTEEQEPSNKP